MKMEVKIISKEMIKPSSPTPIHLKTHKLSLLDHLAPPLYVPVILFYTNDQFTTNEKSQLLKQSLSQTLTRFYPFAGKIKDSVSVECDDEGVHYEEAKVNCHLSEYLAQPDLGLLCKFLPGEPTLDQPIGDRATKIQVTVFACGGIVLGSFFYHQIADGTAISTFLKDWANTARKSQCPSPTFDASALFPLNESYPKDATWFALLSPFFNKGRFVTRRFVFDGSAISQLKARANESSSTMLNLTRVEAVTALICKCIMAVFREKSGTRTQRPTLVSHQVNIRQRAEPKYSQQYMGNFQWTEAANCMAGDDDDDDTEVYGLVRKLRAALKKIDNEFVQRLQGEGGFTNTRDVIMEMKREFSEMDEGTDYIRFSSWCKFGLYEVDFGWGKPIWTSTAGFPDSDSMLLLPNLMVLMDARSGGGIEAWVNLDHNHMAILENHKEFLQFASNNPSPL